MTGGASNCRNNGFEDYFPPQNLVILQGICWWHGHGRCFDMLAGPAFWGNTRRKNEGCKQTENPTWPMGVTSIGTAKLKK